MKTNNPGFQSRHSTLLNRHLLSALVLLLLMGLGSIVRAQPSPVGAWDCVISGSRGGLAQLTFYDDGTFNGTEIIVPNAPPSARKSLIIWDVGSNGLGVRPSDNGGQVSFFLYGSTTVNGPWGFDNRGRIIGSFLEVANVEPIVQCSTNENVTTVYETTTVPVQNPDGSISYFTTNITTFITNAPTITCATNITSGLTNTINFVAKVVPGKRLTMVATTSLGNMTIRGVPLVSLIDLSGSWYGTRKQNHVAYFEFFDLFALPDPPNMYEVDGRGPGYSYTGLAMLSSQKKIAFALDLAGDAGYQSTRAVIGSFSVRNLQATTAGIDAPPGHDALTGRATFQVTKRTSVP